MVAVNLAMLFCPIATSAPVYLYVLAAKLPINSILLQELANLAHFSFQIALYAAVQQPVLNAYQVQFFNLRNVKHVLKCFHIVLVVSIMFHVQFVIKDLFLIRINAQLVKIL